MHRLKRYGLDLYTLLLLATVALAVLLPARGQWAWGVSQVAYYAVALLFFLYGARLKVETVLSGLANWRLQGPIFAATFVVMPLFGLALAATLGWALGPELTAGVIFLSILPSTVQSSVAFVGLARGDVAAAICGAALSNLVGVVLTPLLAALLLNSSAGGISWKSVGDISIQILLPFVLGLIVHRLIGAWVERQRVLTTVVDRGSILLIVYSAFSAGVVAGVWQAVPLSSLAAVAAADVVLLLAIGVGLSWLGQRLRLPPGQQTALLFCGATKSLASGVPIAMLLFSAHTVSIVVLPIMLYHPLQLLVFAAIAQQRRIGNSDQISLA